MLTPQQQPAGEPPAPMRPKRTAVIVLAITTGLLFVATALFGSLLYITVKVSVAQGKEIDARGIEIAELREKAKASEDEAAKARNERETLRFNIARDDKCRDAGKAYREAAIANDPVKSDTAWQLILSNC